MQQYYVVKGIIPLSKETAIATARHQAQHDSSNNKVYVVKIEEVYQREVKVNKIETDKEN